VKVHLLHRDQDLDLQRPLPWNTEALTNDLSLNTLFSAMAQSDKSLFEVCQKTILLGLNNDVETIRYRQEVLRDCLKYPAIPRELYRLAVAALEEERRNCFFTLMHYPNSVLRRSIDALEIFLGTLKRLREIADLHADEWFSEGLTVFFAMLKEELSDDYLVLVRNHLEQLKSRNGVLLGAGLGQANKGTNYVLHTIDPQHHGRWGWLTRLTGQRRAVLQFSVHPRDESGANALAELRDRGISRVASVLAQSADHARSFFRMLQTELAFYVGSLNLHEQLTIRGEPSCFPLPAAAEERQLSLRSLHDICLALSMERRVIGNDANADRRDLVMVTGANQGGKSTFLRSVGLAQLMMQCGMFVTADAFCSSLCDGLFTHYKREEDVSMRSGKLDEELSRMSEIIDHITIHPMVLFNESFAATNEREGSEIARQIVSALLDRRVRMICVTHLYELAHGFYQRNAGNVLFLRADRQTDGARTYKLAEGGPLETSFGEDLYNSIFGAKTGS
jgi:hypothetical protein